MKSAEEETPEVLPLSWGSRAMAPPPGVCRQSQPVPASAAVQGAGPAPSPPDWAAPAKPNTPAACPEEPGARVWSGTVLSSWGCGARDPPRTRAAMTRLEEDPEFDFEFLFEFNQSGPGATTEHYTYPSSSLGPALPLPTAPPTVSGCHELQTVGLGGPPGGYGAVVDAAPGYFLAGGGRPNGAPPALESPRIEITPYLGLHPHSQFFPDTELDALPGARRPSNTATLGLPPLDAYRDPSGLSPASSLSSRSGHSEASSFESGCSYSYVSPQTSPWQSPCVSPRAAEPDDAFPRGLGSLLGSPRPSPAASPRPGLGEDGWLAERPSRPCSPSGHKRRLAPTGSPQPSPGASPAGSPRLSVTEDSWLGAGHFPSSAIVAAINALSTDGLDLGDGLPPKARRTAEPPTPSLALKLEPACEDLGAPGPPATGFSGDGPPRKPTFCDQFLAVPQPPYTWARPRSPVAFSPTLPALDWQLPARSGPYELRMEVQPKSHHRAHYETEGSRGAVKAAGGGHPSVQLHGYVSSEPLTLQLFIGTADDRLLRPHAFYQVHRITGKTVATSSQEAVLAHTKVLEIPLLPQNHMRAVIDCAGILKLRNSDIELRKGETDIGRKNTRVRLVFRVHVPQPGGRTLSLQVASNPIECSQRSAQELPLVEKQSAASGPVLGGRKMVLSGHNFLPDSKVIFVEKAPDGHHVWEMEAKTDRDLCQQNSLVVEIPPFRNLRISSPVQVSFYVCNGKRKRSQLQPYTYLPAHAPIKTEPADEYDDCSPLGFSPQLGLGPSPTACMLPSGPPLLAPTPSTSPMLHELTPAALKAGPTLCHLGLAAPSTQDLLPGPPQPSALLQPQ
ncbi:nuclear factor of activated T-cells, cytoplasmic 1 isoform X2 [Erinaceus europaeus]|uniref:Nuclear factor of activated T-cells, cytoplasmic 1 isoform X2 n=1 Tax=Erinaceus europaeus TaxID=9365 RepID=A0ABM3W0F1_ERIEU|nr:nuclear factor of activated T-cells, cytoplasmic 1 isoform X2 [Erinaceus europaeus]